MYLFIIKYRLIIITTVFFFLTVFLLILIMFFGPDTQNARHLCPLAIILHVSLAACIKKKILPTTQNTESVVHFLHLGSIGVESYL